jgi:hypothetical protein
MKRVYFAWKIKDSREISWDYYYDWRWDIIWKNHHSQVEYTYWDAFYKYWWPIYYQEHWLLCDCVFSHKEVAINNMEDVSKSDLVFAFINSDDCYWTLAEIWFAFWLGIPVHIYYTSDVNINEMRFAFKFSSTCQLVSDHMEWRKIFHKNYLFKRDYKEYLKSIYWKELSQECKDEAWGRCRLCNSNKRVEAHHRSYANIWNKELEKPDIIVVCHKCHSKFHDKPE